jgi:hypothetical protein
MGDPKGVRRVIDRRAKSVDLFVIEHWLEARCRHHPEALPANVGVNRAAATRR